MNKDVTTLTRYFILLVIVFILWLFLIHNFHQETNLGYFFGKEEHSLYILNKRKK